MLDNSPVDPALQWRQILHPKVTPRPADAAECSRLAPWFALRGQVPAALDIACYSDGGGSHAPETLEACRSVLASTGSGIALLYRHCGVQAQPLDPLLPRLLQGLSYDGPVHALRRPRGESSLTPGPSELALVAAMLSRDSAVLFVDDLQERVVAQGALRPAPVVLSLFHNPLARGDSR